MSACEDQARILAQASISPEQLLRSGLLPLSRGSIYEACASGEIECFKIGKRIVIPTAPLKRRLGIEAA